MQRLNSQDAVFVYAEAGGWPLHMGSLAVFDVTEMETPLDRDRLIELFSARLPHLSLFRHRMVQVPGKLDKPVWVEDGEVDIGDHITQYELPTPGTDEQLAALVSQLLPPPVALDRPLWDMSLITGVRGGERVALLTRIHHSATDGIRGVKFQEVMYDLEPDAPLERPGVTTGAGGGTPSTVGLTYGAVQSLATVPVRLVRTAGHLVSAVGRVVRMVAGRRHRGMTLPLTAPRTPFNAPVGAERSTAFVTLPLGPMKAIAKREDATVNDVVMALIGGTLRRYLRSLDELPERSLIAGVPVGLADTSGGRAISGNRWEVMFATLGTDIEDFAERVRRIHESTRAGKALQEAIGGDVWMDLLDIPPPLVSLVAGGYGKFMLSRLHPTAVNMIVSNVRGAPIPLYLAGARLVANYPFGPIADGIGLNLTVLSYLDGVDFGFNMCPGLVDDPWALVTHLRAEAEVLGEQVAAG